MTTQLQKEFWISSGLFPFVHGWIRDPEDLDRIITLQVAVDGTTVVTCKADRPRNNAKSDIAGGGGFRLVLPLEFYDGEARNLEIFSLDRPHDALLSRPVVFPDWRISDNANDSLYGAVFECSAGEVRGFALNASDLLAQPVVHLYIDGLKVSSQRASRRADFLPYSKDDHRRHAFSFEIPNFYNDGSDHSIDVVVEGGSSLWPGAQLLKLLDRPHSAQPVSWAVQDDGRIRVMALRNGEYPHNIVLDVVTGGEVVDSVIVTYNNTEAVSSWSWHDAAEPFNGSIDVVSNRSPGILLSKSDEFNPEHALAISSASVDVDGRLKLTLGSTVALRTTLSLAAIFDGEQIVEFLAKFYNDTNCEVELQSVPPDFTTLDVAWSSDRHARLRDSDYLRLSLREDVDSDLLYQQQAPVVPLTHQHRERLSGQLPKGLIRRDECGVTYGEWWLDDVARAVRGYVIRPATPWRLPRVEILTDGTSVAIIDCVVDEADPVPHFAYVLPDLLPQVGNVLVTCRLESGDALPPADGITLPPLRGIEVQILDARHVNFTLSVRGWVLNHRKPGAMIGVSLLVDGKLATKSVSRPGGKADPLIPSGALVFELRAHAGPVGIRERAAVVVAGEVIQLSEYLTDAAQQDAVGEQEDVKLALPMNTGIVVGSVDKVEGTRVSGWALSKGESVRAPGLIVQLGEYVVGYTRPRLRRSDVNKTYSVEGNFGFLYDLPPNVGIVAPESLVVRPAIGENKITRSSSSLQARIVPEITSRRRRRKRVVERLSASSVAPSEISVIILNKNGAALLDQLFSSAQRYERFEEIEWVVVDHGSSDGSQEVCSRWNSEKQNILFLNRAANFSFSSSNNFGAALSTRPYLVFMNNDIVLKQPVLQRLVGYLVGGDVGIVGLKLIDVMHEDSEYPSAPVQHIGVHFGPELDNNGFVPFEAREVPELADVAHIPVLCPAVTGALMAVTRQSFDRVGGFDEEYFYGYEDVDLALKIGSQLQLACLCDNSMHAAHYRGFTRVESTKGDPRRLRNSRHFNLKWGASLRVAARASLGDDSGVWFGHRTVVAFLVSESGDTSVGGDYFTALELGRALSATWDLHVAFLPPEKWYDLKGVDVAIAMVDRFDPLRISGAKPTLTLVAWARNWFDRWCDRDGTSAYHCVWASSQIAADYMCSRLDRTVDVVRLATAFNVVSGVQEGDRNWDYAFVGSRFGVAREIEFALRPGEIKGQGVVFGHNWDGTPLGAISQGGLRYSEVPDVYRRSKIVIDDANGATKDWGSVNSRVFDAIASGALVISNGVSGAREVFGGLVPTWESADELTSCLNYWISHSEERAARVADLQSIVYKHTYNVRSVQATESLSRGVRTKRVAIKISAPRRDDISRRWGDVHFAESLSQALRKRGYVVRVDFMDEWYNPLASTDDVTISLRGLGQYKPAAHQVNLLWIISHPESVSLQEVSDFDHVFVASVPYARQLSALTSVPVSYLLQCTDPARFSMSSASGFPEHSVLFVGNSRNVPRPFVLWAFELGADLSVYGGGWGSFLPENVVRGEFVPNEVLGELYSSAGCVLCDHWDDMRKHGFVSNRVFDVLASGGYVISDPVVSLSDQLGVDVRVCGDKTDLRKAMAGGRRVSSRQRRVVAEYIHKFHTFDVRAEEIERVITGITCSRASLTSTLAPLAKSS